MTRVASRRQPFTITTLLITALLSILLPSLASGQGSTPDRGFQPGGSYALSEIESINTNNGNLMLNLAVGKLAPGRGGLSGQLNLHYDSKLYDSHTQYYEDWEHLEFGQPQTIIRNMLQTSDQGGWHYGTGYQVQLIDRMYQYPPEIAPQYPAQETIYHYKLNVAFPDGSLHEFYPRVGSMVDQGYSDIRPDGYQSRYIGGYVQDVPYFTTNVTYYTFDGTYIRLDVQHDSDANWWNNPWTLYFPDGTTVTNFGTRITDRNGNYAEWSNITYNGHAATQLMDQLGRKVILEHQGFSGGDVIHVPGVGGADLTYQVYWKSLQVYKTYSTAELGQHNQDPDGYPEILTSQYVISRIDLPAATGGMKYLFGYNAADYGSTPCCTPSYGWGELNSVTLPSGAQAQYQYQLDGQNGPGFGYLWSDVLNNNITRKDLTYQQQYDGGSTPVTETWNYSIGIGSATIVAPDGGTVTQVGQPATWTQSADGTITEKIWQGNRPQNFTSTSAYDPVTGIDPYDPARVNSYVKTEFTSIRNAGGTLSKTAIKDYSYDKNGNVTSVREYDWVDYSNVPRNAWGSPTGIPGSAVLKRVTATNYVAATPDASDSSSNDPDSYWIPTSPALKEIPASTEISNGSTTLTRSEFFYDNSATTGNLTQQKSWDSTKGAYSNPLTGSNSISTSTVYNQYGSPTLTTDARGTQTQIVYGSVGGFTDLYPTQVKTAYQTSVQRTETREYDFSTGLGTRTTDVDNNVSNSTTYDTLGRPTLVKAAEAKSEEMQTSTTYSDVDRRVIVRSDLNTPGDGKLVNIQHYDQLGRLRLARQLEDATTQSATDETTGIKVQTRYEVSGNFSYVLNSNPYRAASSATAGGESTMGWTRTKTNNGGRVIEVQTFGGASAPAPWGTNTLSTGTVTTSYDANFTTVTDQAGKVRRTMIDALGRLVRVDEPDASGNLGTTISPVQPTTYGYDALANLTTVTQGVQSRSFVYSSLGRLTSATNPESGTVSYQYDNNGNLSQKTDARSMVTSYMYDALNRNTSVNYSNTTIGSPDVHDILKFYDGATNGKGRFWYSYTAGNISVGNNVDHTAIDSYDALGRPLIQRQLFKLDGTWSPTYQTLRTYNRIGAVTTQTYPSGHTITYTYDAAGRSISFTGTLGDGVNRTYATNMSYSPSGALGWEQFGTNTTLYHKLFYNSRGQLFDTRVSTVNDNWDWNRGRLILYYSSSHIWGQSGTDNNGNVRFAETWIPPENAALDQADTLFEDAYTYDSLNRLTSVVGQRMSVATGWGNWQQQFRQQYAYDRYGNRTIDAAQTWGTGINNKQFTVDPATNRLGVPSGQTGTMSYDSAGNLTTDAYTGYGIRTYDVENRMTTAADNTGQISRYTYNAEGERVRVQVASSQEQWQIYDFDGELLAEYAASAPASAPEKEYGYRNGQLLITASGRFNVAAAANGAVATASSAHTCCGFSTTGAINGNNRGPWANGEGWNDATEGAVPDWIQVDFAGNKSIDEIDVFSLHDNYTTENTPTETQTFTLYGLLAFEVQYWNGSSWTTVPGGNVTGNNKVWRKFTFSPITTGKIRVWISAVPDLWSRVVEIQAFGTSAGAEKVHWLVPDHLGTPRMVIDETGYLANIKRHDYLPFGEELFAPSGGRTLGLGYTSGDGVRQQFTGKERDVEINLDYFGARYYASLQGRFTSADPYDPNLLRQETEDPLEANALLGEFIGQPQHWNRYAYCLNNPLQYIDPDGRYEKIVSLLGKDIKLKIGDDIQQKDPQLFNKILSNLLAVVDKINSVSNELNDEQKERITSMNGIEVQSKYKAPGMRDSDKYFMLTTRFASTDSLDTLTGAVVHDSHHADQKRRRANMIGTKAEREASCYTVPIVRLMKLSQSTIDTYEYDCLHGHGEWGPGPKKKPEKKKKKEEEK